MLHYPKRNKLYLAIDQGLRNRLPAKPDGWTGPSHRAPESAGIALPTCGSGIAGNTLPTCEAGITGIISAHLLTPVLREVQGEVASLQLCT